MILEWLPAYPFVGPKQIGRVSRAFHFLNTMAHLKKEEIKTLVNSVNTVETAHLILLDDKILNHLTYTADQLVLLGSKKDKVAWHIVKTPQFFNKLDVGYPRSKLSRNCLAHC